MKHTISPLSLLKLSKLKKVLSFGTKGYLADIGWFNSFDSLMPVDGNGEAIPWVTYSFIDFIRNRINQTQRVFEFGSGNSTLFYAKHAGQVVSVEHDKPWYDRISSQTAPNSKIVFCELEDGGEYCKMPARYSEKFHIIIVDGRDRVNCCKEAIKSITPDGVIVLDDSERTQYQEAIDFLKQKGFKELPFTGISPGSFINKSTTIFYKTDNCLGI